MTTTAEAPPAEAPWRRLNPRMLLVHPVQEVVRAAPALLGLLIAGSNNGHGNLWALAGVAIAIGAGTLRWFTTSFRITPEQVQVRRGLLRRQLRAVSRDRVRTVDVSANPLQRVLGLVRVTVGTGRSDRNSDGGLRLDGLDAVEAGGLRDTLLHDRPGAADAGGAAASPAGTTPGAALAEARARNAPVLLSRHIIARSDFAAVAVEDLAFPRSYVLVTPAYGEPTGEVRELVDAICDHVRIWLR